MGKKLTQEEFLEKCKTLGKLDKFDLNNINYDKFTSKIEIYCKTHNNYFITIPIGFLESYGCPECTKDHYRSMFAKNNEIFIKESKKNFGEDHFDYSYVEYVNNYTKVKLICNIYKLPFYIRPTSHLSTECGCPICSESKGERKIALYLTKNKIEYKRRYKFDDCIDKTKLRFDFAVFDNNDNLVCLIEFKENNIIFQEIFLEV